MQLSFLLVAKCCSATVGGAAWLHPPAGEGVAAGEGMTAGVGVAAGAG